MSGLHRTSLLGTVLLIACSSDTGKGYEIPESADLVDTPRALRLDVYPPGNLDLLPQTFTVLPEEIEDVYLALAPTLTVTGTVEGTIPSPVDITIPSSNTEPVEARITLEVPGTVMRAVTTSDARGNYSVEVPSGVGYRAVAVALDPFDLPLYIEDNIVLNDTSPLNIQMGLGIPVSGIAQQTNGATLPTGSRVRLIDDFTGEVGPYAPLATSGEYLLRALPGDYTLLLEGSTGSTMPSVPWTLTVTDEDIAIRQDLEPGTLSISNVSGVVVDEDGRAIDDAEVRFTAISLDDLPGDTTDVVATDTDRNGLFNRQLPQGTWLMEVIPVYDDVATLSPTMTSIEVSGSTTEVGSVELPQRANLDARVMIGGQPARNIVVTAQEQGFNRYTYTASSDDEGWVHFELPNVPLDLTLQSPDADQPITRLEVPSPTDVSRIDLDDEGSLVTGILLDPSANPLLYALVEIRDDEGTLLGSTITDGSGEFRVTVGLLEAFEQDSGN